MDLLYLKLHSSKQTSEQTQKRRLTELLVLFGLPLGSLLCLIGCWIPLLLLVLLLPLLRYLCSDPYPLLPPLQLVLLLGLAEVPLLLLPGLLYDFMHHANVCQLIFDVVEAAFGIFRKVFVAGHVVAVWAKDDVDVGQF